ncbi:MAG: ABC transporter ATP-binding protein [Candidatus Bilamarchaeaceae archaeon]
MTENHEKPDQNPEISVRDLRIYYGSRLIVEPLSFHVGKGEVFGLLGGNGAGKSTIMKVLAGLKKDYEGRADILGRDAKDDYRSFSSKVAYIPQYPEFFDDFTVLENLMYFARMYGMPDPDAAAEKAIKRFSLDNFRGRRACELSGGYRQMLSLAVSFITEPVVVLFDEPTSAMDVRAKRMIMDMVLRLREEGKAIVYTSHNLDEVEEVCDRVAIMSKGKLLWMGDLKSMIREQGGPYRLVITLKETITNPQVIGKLKYSTMESASGNKIQLSVEQDRVAQAISEIIAVLKRNRAEVDWLDVREPDIKKAFMKITGD